MNTIRFSIKRIAHALLWLFLLLFVTMVVMSLFANVWNDFGIGTSEMGGAIALLVLLPVALTIWFYSIRFQWSLKWPLIVFLISILPVGLTIVGILGFGKLIIQFVGRGDTLAWSSLREPIPAARPRGLVEYTSNE